MFSSFQSFVEVTLYQSPKVWCIKKNLNICFSPILNLQTTSSLSPEEPQASVSVSYNSYNIMVSTYKTAKFTWCGTLFVVTDSLYLAQTVFNRHRQSLSVTDSLCLSQTVCICHIQTISVTDRICLSETVCVCHRQSVSVTDMLCLSQKVCFCHRRTISVTGRICLCFLVYCCPPTVGRLS